jgi:protein CpxP
MNWPGRGRDRQQRSTSVERSGIWHRYRKLIASGVLFATLGIGVGAFLAPLASARWFGWGGGPTPERMREHAQRAVERVLGDVGASDTQRERVQAIAARLIEDVAPLLASHREQHEAWRTALSAPAVDRGALEALRRDALAKLDQVSARVVDALAQASSELTPEQRLAVMERIRERRGRHGWHRRD